MCFTIPAAWEGLPVRAILRRLRVSHTQLVRLKALPDGILRNGSRVTVRAVLHAGDELSLHLEDTAPGNVLPSTSPVPVPILFEDEALLAAAKPAGIPTHPSRAHPRDSLESVLAASRAGRPPVFRVITRLDRDTSGVVLFAKTAHAASLLCEMIGEAARAASCDPAHARARGKEGAPIGISPETLTLLGARPPAAPSLFTPADPFLGKSVRKTYLALLSGELPADGRLRTLDTGIRRESEDSPRRVVCPPGEGSRAITRYEVVRVVRDRGEPFTLVRAYPFTGRTHQLRVHFAAIGHTILGDPLYGSPDSRIARQALHAAKLALPHPLTGEPLTLLAPLPQDMRALLG